jgi:hypothetical protein
MTREGGMLNRRALSSVQVDSASLQPLETYGHRFTQPGLFRIDLRRNGVVVARHSLEVVEDLAAPGQAMIDVGRLVDPQEVCGCREAEPGNRRIVAAGGVGLWWTGGREQGLSLTGIAVRRDGVTEAFDSRELTEGDLFSRIFLRPGTYRLQNRAARAEGQIRVTNPRRAGDADRDPGVAGHALSVMCRAGGFDPADIELVRGQGIVWFVVEATPYRIVVEPERLDE